VNFDAGIRDEKNAARTEDSGKGGGWRTGRYLRLLGEL